LSSAEPARPIDWVIPTRAQAAWKFLAVYSPDSTGGCNTGLLERG
jgi:hypothetical protein